MKKIIENIKRNKLRSSFAFIAALSAAAAVAIQPLASNARYFYASADDEGAFSDYATEGNSDMTPKEKGQFRANICRNAVYSDLCTLGTIYLSNCSKGAYTGTPTLYEQMYQSLSNFDMKASDVFGIKNASSRGVNVDQSHYNITNIDSSYFYFYVEYDGEYLTNIEGVDEMSEKNRLANIMNMYDKSYYLRENNKIKTKPLHDESGLGKTEVYYTEADQDSSDKLTSEYIDSDKLMLGAANKDFIDRYTICFSPSGDNVLYSYPNDSSDYNSYLRLDDDTGELYYDEDSVMYEYGDLEDADGSYQTVTTSQITMYPGSAEYKKACSQEGGALNKFGVWTDLESFPNYYFESLDTSKLTVFMSPKTDIATTSAALITKYQKQYDILNVVWICLSILSIGSALTFAIITAARKAEKYKDDQITFFDRLFKPDFSALAIVTGVVLLCLSISYGFSYYGFQVSPLQTSLPALISFLSFMICLIAYDKNVKIIKTHVKGSGRPRLLLNVINDRTLPLRKRIEEKKANIGIVKSYRKLSIKTKYIIHSIITVAVASIIWHIAYFDISLPIYAFYILLLLTFAYFVGYTAKLIRDIMKLNHQLDEILDDSDNTMGKCEPILKESSKLYSLDKKLSEVSNRAEQAVDKQVQSEKLKVELVTNVSHDLKTPLTSIISYIDLLSKTDLPDEAQDYVKVLSHKANKLRDIVSDVFSLAKAASGVEISMQRLDLAILVRQVIADNEDKVLQSEKELRIDIAPNHAPIMGDGAKLYRVIQNLLDNALKYSMDYTRIYITLSENDDRYLLSVKNVSSYEMKFSAGEITERFTRGDKSRSDGGSGLGLSIAKSFTEACGGEFSINIDGDVFAALVKFDKLTEQETADDQLTDDESDITQT